VVVAPGLTAVCAAADVVRFAGQQRWTLEDADTGTRLVGSYSNRSGWRRRRAGICPPSRSKDRRNGGLEIGRSSNKAPAGADLPRRKPGLNEGKVMDREIPAAGGTAALGSAKKNVQPATVVFSARLSRAPFRLSATRSVLPKDVDVRVAIDRDSRATTRRPPRWRVPARDDAPRLDSTASGCCRPRKHRTGSPTRSSKHGPRGADRERAPFRPASAARRTAKQVQILTYLRRRVSGEHSHDFSRSRATNGSLSSQNRQCPHERGRSNRRILRPAGSPQPAPRRKQT